MRSNASEYDLIAPGTLPEILKALASGKYTPVAGGTEIMVMLGVGKLAPKSLLSLWGVKELRFFDETPESLTIGAGCTFTDLRKNKTVATDFPLLSRAAAWTGSIANQNRGTLGGNIVNASPAADSPPALLAYEAELDLVSVRGTRKIAYSEFHLGYKKTALAQDELLRAIILPRRFGGHFQYSRKVGTRNAQAISKIAIAGVGKLHGGVVEKIALGAASLRETPIRCTAVERSLLGKKLDESAIAAARKALESEIAPIDDIRSTEEYRRHVAGNLVEEFLREWLKALG